MNLTVKKSTLSTLSLHAMGFPVRCISKLCLDADIEGALAHLFWQVMTSFGVLINNGPSGQELVGFSCLAKFQMQGGIRLDIARQAAPRVGLADRKRSFLYNIHCRLPLMVVTRRPSCGHAALSKARVL